MKLTLLQHLQKALYYRIDYVPEVWTVKTVGKDCYEVHIDFVSSEMMALVVKLFCEFNNVAEMTEREWNNYVAKEQNLFASFGDNWEVLKIK